MPDKKKTDKSVKCEACRYSVAVDQNERRFLCDNPALKTFGKNVKHGRRFACGYGVQDVAAPPPDTREADGETSIKKKPVEPE
jgi:hypothetical protein